MSDLNARLTRLEAREAAEAARQIAQADSERPPTPGSPVARRNAVVEAARAFVEHHRKECAPGMLFPLTFTETWSDEYERRLATLIEAVEAL